MSLSAAVAALATRIGQEIKAIRAEVASALNGKANDSAVVHTTGNETVAGLKTFTNGIGVPTPTQANSPVRNDDARNSNARTPVAHASSHAPGGSDALSGYAATTHNHDGGDIATGQVGYQRLPQAGTGSSAYGIVRLQGDLGGTYSAPTVKEGAGFFPRLDANGRLDPAAHAQGPIALLYQTTVHQVANNVAAGVPMQFQAEMYDTHNGHDNATNNSRWTCPSGWAGYYLVSGMGMIASGTTGVRLCWLRKNGSIAIPGTLQRAQPPADNGGAAVAANSAVVYLAVGDYVEVVFLHTQGSAVNTFCTSPYIPALSVAWLRP